jgi:hypothetical protein
MHHGSTIHVSVLYSNIFANSKQNSKAREPGSQGESFDEKPQRSKISWHSPFKNVKILYIGRWYIAEIHVANISSQISSFLLFITVYSIGICYDKVPDHWLRLQANECQPGDQDLSFCKDQFVSYPFLKFKVGSSTVEGLLMMFRTRLKSINILVKIFQ